MNWTYTKNECPPQEFLFGNQNSFNAANVNSIVTYNYAHCTYR